LNSPQDAMNAVENFLTAQQIVVGRNDASLKRAKSLEKNCEGMSSQHDDHQVGKVKQLQSENVRMISIRSDSTRKSLW
jgi:hypothetical protein